MQWFEVDEATAGYADGSVNSSNFIESCHFLQCADGETKHMNGKNVANEKPDNLLEENALDWNGF